MKNATWIYDPLANVQVAIKEDRSRNRYQSFLRINKVESTHSGSYTCRFENDKGNSEVEVTIVVKLAPKIESISVTSDLGTKKVDKRVEIEARKDYKFTCNAVSYPPPLTSWKFNGHDMMEEESFKIINASTSDEGTYECLAKNAVKTTKKNIAVRLMMPPTSDAPRSKELILENKSDAELTCEIYARPRPDFKWKFNGVEIDGSSKYVINDNTLTFTVAKGDAGTFSCEGSNGMGSLKLEFIVKIKSKLRTP